MKDIARLVRIDSAGFEGIVFLIGPLLGGWRGSLRDFAILWLLGVLINSYIFALNDLVDLPYDKANPARASTPLVDGRLDERVALGLSVVLPIAATMIVMAARWPLAAEVPFIAMLMLAAFVNIYQKMTRHPLLMDLLYALTMAAPLPVCTRALLPSVAPLVWYATVALFLLALQLNSISGNLKDLEPDQNAGFRTVAVSMGARVAPDGTLLAGPRYSSYCWSLLGSNIAALAATLGWALRDRPAAETATVTVLSMTAITCGVHDLRRLLRRMRRPSPAGREIHFAAGFAVLLGAVAVGARLVVLLAALTSLAIWLLGFRLYWRWDRRRCAS